MVNDKSHGTSSSCWQMALPVIHLVSRLPRDESALQQDPTSPRLEIMLDRSAACRCSVNSLVPLQGFCSMAWDQDCLAIFERETPGLRSKDTSTNIPCLHCTYLPADRCQDLKPRLNISAQLRREPDSCVDEGGCQYVGTCTNGTFISTIRHTPQGCL